MSAGAVIVSFMSERIERASLTVSIDAGTDLTAADAETMAAKFLELVLRDCGISWGPGINREVLPYGTTSYYLTEEPLFLVEVDTITTACCSIATIQVDEPGLVETIYDEMVAFAIDNQVDGATIIAGRSHPESGFMYEYDPFDSVIEDQMVKEYLNRPLTVRVSADGLVSDANPRATYTPGQPLEFEYFLGA